MRGVYRGAPKEEVVLALECEEGGAPGGEQGKHIIGRRNGKSKGPEMRKGTADFSR